MTGQQPSSDEFGVGTVMQQVAPDPVELFAIVDDLIVSPDVQPLVDYMRAAGMTNQAILKHLAKMY